MGNTPCCCHCCSQRWQDSANASVMASFCKKACNCGMSKPQTRQATALRSQVVWRGEPMALSTRHRSWASSLWNTLAWSDMKTLGKPNFCKAFCMALACTWVRTNTAMSRGCTSGCWRNKATICAAKPCDKWCNCSGALQYLALSGGGRCHTVKGGSAWPCALLSGLASLRLVTGVNSILPKFE